jgi:uncharacterized protein YdeI (YjbR/CyaY-like superfamily)
MEIERTIYSITQYIKEVKKAKVSTEKVKVNTDEAILFPDETCQKLKIVI